MTRTNFLVTALTACVSFLARPAAVKRSLHKEASPDTIFANDPGAEKVLVIDKNTGEQLKLVYAANAREGWVLQYAQSDDKVGKHNALGIVLDAFGRPLLRHRRGEFELRQTA